MDFGGAKQFDMDKNDWKVLDGKALEVIRSSLFEGGIMFLKEMSL